MAERSEQDLESLDHELTSTSDDSQLNTSDITSQHVRHFEHQLLWSSDESTQVMYQTCKPCYLAAARQGTFIPTSLEQSCMFACSYSLHVHNYECKKI